MVCTTNDKLNFKLTGLSGASALGSSSAKERYMFGSPGYLAPELISGIPYGVAIDIFSLGAMMYAMLTGELPFYS